MDRRASACSFAQSCQFCQSSHQVFEDHTSDFTARARDRENLKPPLSDPAVNYLTNSSIRIVFAGKFGSLPVMQGKI